VIDRPRVLVLGAGSIGSRHAANIASLGAEVTISDPDRDRAAAVATRVGAIVATDPDPLGFGGIVVASPSSLHSEHLAWALVADVPIYVEKPLVMSASEVTDAIRAASDRIAVGYNLRFHPGYRRLRECLLDGSLGSPVSARFWFGSYLPDWRPDVDYRESYSAQRRLGGGILHDAIHEIDLALWFFGWPLRTLASVRGRFGPLDIDVDDTVRAILGTDSGVPVSVDLDYLSRRYRRGVEIIGTDATARFDWARAVIEIETAAEVRSFPVDTAVDQTYIETAEQFLSMVTGGRGECATGLDGIRSIELVEAVEAVSV
jgi:predicted dehydrogenase